MDIEITGLPYMGQYEPIWNSIANVEVILQLNHKQTFDTSH